MKKINRLFVILGDQLNYESPYLKQIQKDDCVWMAEVVEESTKVWSHKARIVIFIAAMRHYADWLTKQQFNLHYTKLDDPKNAGSLSAELSCAIRNLKPKEVVLIEPGEWSVSESLINVCKQTKIPYTIQNDSHFLCSTAEFSDYAKNHHTLRMEFFYRQMRERYNILMDGDKPTGGQWNYDKENRKTLSAAELDEIPKPVQLSVTKITKEVIALVEKLFSEHPGNLEQFNWPVTPEHAQIILKEFINKRLKFFGDYQDAMWTEQPFIYHSRLSAALNLKLISPLTVIKAAEKAYRENRAAINSVEGFIRQVLGWREYIRGTYWLFMPKYLEWNYFKAGQPLPEFYWTAKTDMNCLHHTIKQTLEYGYAHHIQRLMVTGLFALMLGVFPRAIHEWYLAVYVDAVEWVELPNTLGMSQYIDGGKLASKPYIASGKYIQRMSNYCQNCRFNPAKAVGEDACPFTTLYWDFLFLHEKKLSTNPRMLIQLRNASRIKNAEKADIKAQAKKLRETYGLQ